MAAMRRCNRRLSVTSPVVAVAPVNVMTDDGENVQEIIRNLVLIYSIREEGTYVYEASSIPYG